MSFLVYGEVALPWLLEFYCCDRVSCEFVLLSSASEDAPLPNLGGCLLIIQLLNESEHVALLENLRSGVRVDFKEHSGKD